LAFFGGGYEDFVPSRFLFLKTNVFVSNVYVVKVQEDGNYTWRTWIGSASKNSCATRMVYSEGLRGISVIELYQWSLTDPWCGELPSCSWTERRA
jgi:hypothetical protein